jgi:hypothetical protein
MKLPDMNFANHGCATDSPLIREPRIEGRAKFQTNAPAGSADQKEHHHG